MLNPKQIKEIKEHLEKAQNPIFFFDNDQDGLCSFLLLQRYIGRGKGIPIKSFPELSKEYFKKVNELQGDYIFILDKPMISKEFFDKVQNYNIPVVWIDHHFIEDNYIPNWVNYYNPILKNKKEIMSTTSFCWQVVKQKRNNDLWLAVIGCISDNYLPDFYTEFKKTYPDLINENAKNALDIFYKSSIGTIAQMLGAGLKDRTTNVINMLKFLMKVQSPYEILNKTPENKTMHKRFEFIDNRLKKLIEKAKKVVIKNKLLFFEYRGDMSLSSDIANRLRLEFPDKIIVVVYITGIKANISARGKDIKKYVLKAIKDIKGATGGGHNDAVGAKVMIDDLQKFKKRLQSLLGE